jgi:hypothetical protein
MPIFKRSCGILAERNEPLKTLSNQRSETWILYRIA